MRTNERRVSHRRTALYRSRIAEYLARDLLRNSGYSVLRSCDRDSPVNLVAWSLKRGSLLIRVTTTRRTLSGAAGVATAWREEIDRLRVLPVPPGGSVHIWISADRKIWHRYQVLPGGLMETVL